MSKYDPGEEYIAQRWYELEQARLSAIIKHPTRAHTLEGKPVFSPSESSLKEALERRCAAVIRQQKRHGYMLGIKPCPVERAYWPYFEGREKPSFVAAQEARAQVITETERVRYQQYAIDQIRWDAERARAAMFQGARVTSYILDDVEAVKP